MRVYIRTYGCKVNQVESEELAARLCERGHELVRDEALAQLYVINSCTVTGEADAKVRKGLRHAAALPGVEQVLVTGCSAALHAEELAALSPKVHVLERGALEAFDTCLRGPGSAIGASPTASSPTAQAPIPQALPSLRHTRVPVKVQDGCENFCVYCIVPYARGACRSTPLSRLVAQVAALVEVGTREIVLTGINIGRYHDPETGADLPALIRALRDETGIHRIRLSSIEPPDVCDELCTLLSDGILCEHLHIPLQSGSDAVLSAMGRRYTTAEFAAACKRVRALSPQAAIATDVIVGYPTETDADFEATLRFCRDSGFSKIHVFRFSPRAGTPAAALGALAPSVVAERARRLRELSAELADQYATSQAGRTLEWVVERIDATTGLATLTSREHLSMRISCAGRAQGELLLLPFDMMKSEEVPDPSVSEV